MCKAERKETKARGWVSPPLYLVINSAFNYQLSEGKTWRQEHEDFVIVVLWLSVDARGVTDSVWRSGKLFGEGGIVLWWVGHLEKLKMVMGERKEAWKWRRWYCTGHRLLAVTIPMQAGLECFRVNTSQFPRRTPPLVTDGSWWINTPVPSLSGGDNSEVGSTLSPRVPQ